MVEENVPGLSDWYQIKKVLMGIAGHWNGSQMFSIEMLSFG